MSLHPDFPTSPYAPLIPEQRWFPADEVVETKGREELDLPQKMARLKHWCADATSAEENGQRYDFVFVDQPGFEKHQPHTFAALASSFTEYKSQA